MPQTPGPRAARRAAATRLDDLYWQEAVCNNPAAYSSLINWLEGECSRVLAEMANPTTPLEKIPQLRGEHQAYLRIWNLITTPLREEESLNAYQERSEGRSEGRREPDHGERRGAGTVRFTQ